MISKYLLCLLGIILALPILGVTALAATLPTSISGIGYLLACLLAVAGLITAPWIPKHHFLLTLAGLIAALLIAISRILMGGLFSTSNLEMVTLPRGKETRWMSYILDEQDGLIFGEAFFHQIGGDSSTEHEGITSSLYSAYSEMKAAEGVVPSPVISTYLNLQQPSAFDVIMVGPKNNLHPETGVIFLHGFMGNVTSQCWEVAQAVSKYGAVTACPSTGWRGEWWQAEGQSILKETFQYLRDRGVQKFYLGGFSNGGFGISRMVSQVKNENGLSGLFFIDGIYDGVSIRNTGLPILIIQGANDERMPAVMAREISVLIGNSATYVELNSDHFLIIKEPASVQNAISSWLEDQ
ncbi:MAG: hypothetical protein U0V02_13665 [Anaerolineales bacterium]